MIRGQVAVVRALQAGIDALDIVIAEKATAHPYAGLLADLPRIGTLNLAQIIGEVGPILERATSFDQLAAETGLAPVTRSSAKPTPWRSDTPPTDARDRHCTLGWTTAADPVIGRAALRCGTRPGTTPPPRCAPGWLGEDHLPASAQNPLRPRPRRTAKQPTAA